MNFPLPRPALSLAIAFASASSLHAAPKKDVAPPTPTPELYHIVHSATHALPFSGKVSAVDKVANDFTTENKQKQIRTYTLTPTTQLTRDNASITIDAIKIGEDVRGMAIPKGNGEFETVSAAFGTHEIPTPPVASTPVPTPTPSKITPRPTPKPKAPTPKPSTPKPTVKKATAVTPTPSPTPKN